MASGWRHTPMRRAAARRAEAQAEFVGLVAQISHDLRTPLNIIIGFSDIMQRELLGPLGAERYQGYAGHIRESGFALVKAVEDTLALTRLIAETGPDRRGPVDVAPALAHAARYVAPDAKARRIAVEIPGLLLEAGRRLVVAEAQALEQALLNLLLGLVVAAPPGATVKASAVEARGRLALRLLVVPPAGEPIPSEPARPDPALATDPAPGLCARLPLLVARSLLELQDGTLELVEAGGGRLTDAIVTLVARKGRRPRARSRGR